MSGFYVILREPLEDGVSSVLWGSLDEARHAAEFWSQKNGLDYHVYQLVKVDEATAGKP